MSWLGPEKCIEILSKTQNTKLGMQSECWPPTGHNKNPKHLYSDKMHTLKADFRSEDELM